MRQRESAPIVGALIVMGVVTTLTACVSATADPAVSSKPTPSAKPTAASACADLTEPRSLIFNAPRDYEKGDITAEERNAQLEEARALLLEVEAPEGRIANAIKAVNDYLDEVPPLDDGRPYDPDDKEFFNLGCEMTNACLAAGEEMIINGHGG